MNGDKQSFEKIILTKQESMYRIAYSYVNNTEDALDLVQDAVFKAFVSINKLKNPEYFHTWLTRILINLAINKVKKNRKVLYLEDHKEPVWNPSLSSVESIDLHTALNHLKLKYRTVVILRYFEDMKLEEIADVLKQPVSTIKSQLYRALKQLKITLKEV